MRNILKKLFSDPGTSVSDLDNIAAPDTTSVAAYYDRETDMYLKTYGSIIQAARPTSDEVFINYLTDSLALQDGLKLIDAGCGVCGPSIAFAQQHKIHIDGVTISQKQKEIAEGRISAEGLQDRIRVTRGDFSLLDTIYERNAYDRVFFLESLGYARNQAQVLQSSYEVLKPGAYLYIKDFFSVPVGSKDKKQIQQRAFQAVRDQYDYKVLDLAGIINTLRQTGFYVDFIRPLAFEQDFTKAGMFEQANTGHDIYTNVVQATFQMFEALELRFRKGPRP